jgi:hypothetical protein
MFTNSLVALKLFTKSPVEHLQLFTNSPEVLNKISLKDSTFNNNLCQRLTHQSLGSQRCPAEMMTDLRSCSIINMDKEKLRKKADDQLANSKMIEMRVEDVQEVTGKMVKDAQANFKRKLAVDQRMKGLAKDTQANLMRILVDVRKMKEARNTIGQVPLANWLRSKDKDHSSQDNLFTQLSNNRSILKATLSNL